MISCKVKWKTRSRSESESKQGIEYDVIDPKRDDLAMSRLKLGYNPAEDRTDVR